MGAGEVLGHLLLVRQEDPSAFGVAGFLLLRALPKVSGEGNHDVIRRWVTRQVRNKRQGLRAGGQGKGDRGREKGQERGRREREIESRFLLLLFHVMLRSALRALRAELLLIVCNLCPASARGLRGRTRTNNRHRHKHRRRHRHMHRHRHAGTHTHTRARTHTEGGGRTQVRFSDVDSNNGGGGVLRVTSAFCSDLSVRSCATVGK